MSARVRMTATIEPELLEVARAAVRHGRADSVSDWVNQAMRRQSAHERRLEALAAFIETYENEHGAISDDEVAAVARGVADRAETSRAKSVQKAARTSRRAAGSAVSTRRRSA